MMSQWRISSLWQEQPYGYQCTYLANNCSLNMFYDRWIELNYSTVWTLPNDIYIMFAGKVYALITAWAKKREKKPKEALNTTSIPQGASITSS